MHKTFERTEDLLLRKIDEVVDRGDVSPSEMDCLYKAFKTLYYMTTIEAMDEHTDYDDYRSHTPHHDPMMDGRSMRRGDGRRMSRKMYDRGYSSHSVIDRMIASLEQEMDMAETDYDRAQIQDEIRSLRERQK